MPNKIILPKLLKEQMLEHALSQPTKEVCGLIGGKDNQAITVYPTKNIADDPEHRFLMAPEEQIAAMRTMRETNETLWGIYHSHPNSPAGPSQTDKEMAAYPDVYYFIISLINKAPKLKAFYFNGKHFEDVIYK